MKKRLLIGLAALLSFPAVSGGDELRNDPDIRDQAFSSLLESKRCHTSGVQSITCTYGLEDSLMFTIDGVGEIDAALTFNYVLPDSRYYARFASRPGCVFDSTEVHRHYQPPASNE
jgi:hypothetical protein